MATNREFLFSDRDFNTIRQLVSRHTGISLSEAKRDMVYSRLARRIRVLGLRDFSDYCDVLGSEEGLAELGEFVNAITTNLTSFFPSYLDPSGSFSSAEATAPQLFVSE